MKNYKFNIRFKYKPEFIIDKLKSHYHSHPEYEFKKETGFYVIEKKIKKTFSFPSSTIGTQIKFKIHGVGKSSSNITGIIQANSYSKIFFYLVLCSLIYLIGSLIYQYITIGSILNDSNKFIIYIISYLPLFILSILIPYKQYKNLKSNLNKILKSSSADIDKFYKKNYCPECNEVRNDIEKCSKCGSILRTIA